MAKKPTIFLSYRRASSRELARYVHARLTNLGYRVFIDVEELDGKRFATEIRRSIVQCDYYLIILKPDTLDEKSWVLRELAVALQENKPIIPLIADRFDFDQHVPPELAGLKEYSGIPYTDHYADEAIERIVKALRSPRKKRASSLPLVAAAGGAVALVVLLIVFALPGLSVGNQPTNTPDTISTPTLHAEPTEAASALFDEAVALIEQGSYDEAITDLTRAIELDPENAELYRLRGDAYRGQGDYEAALADYRRALELDPDSSWALTNRGDLYLSMGDYDLAIEDLTRAIELDPEYADLYRLRADA